MKRLSLVLLVFMYIMGVWSQPITDNDDVFSPKSSNRMLQRILSQYRPQFDDDVDNSYKNTNFDMEEVPKWGYLPYGPRFRMAARRNDDDHQFEKRQWFSRWLHPIGKRSFMDAENNDKKKE